MNNAAWGQPNNATSKKVIFKRCVLFSNCRKDNTQVDDGHDINVVMPMYMRI